MHNDTELHLTCSCHSHELHIEKDSQDEMWYGSFWMRGYAEHDWKWKWRQIWHIFVTGKPYGDEIVMTKDHLKELLTYVEKQINQK